MHRNFIRYDTHRIIVQKVLRISDGTLSCEYNYIRFCLAIAGMFLLNMFHI